MILVYVQYFFNSEGRHYFPAWLQETAAALRALEGFVSLKQLEPAQEPEGCYLLLEFTSLDLLRIWLQSQKHDALIAKLEPYCYQEQRSQIFEVGRFL